MLDLTPVYITNGYPGTNVEGSVLRCTEHPDWEIDVDGTPMPEAIRRATQHVKDEEHVSV